MDTSEKEAIRARTDIVELISTYTALRRVGSKFKGLCPFHQEKTPSFNVDPDQGRWHCFGACGMGGDIFTFLMKAENLTFPEATERLAERAGITLSRGGGDPAQARQAQNERDRLFAANAMASRFFRQAFQRDQLARDYAQSRGLAHDTLEAFGVGYAPDDWSQLSGFLLRQKIHPDDAVSAGLISPSRRDDGTFTDRFRGRLMFPIFDVQERVVGFGGRLIVDTPNAPKYLNSPATAVFDKSRTLYGLNRARKAIADPKNETVVVVEGYMDVVAAHQAGIEFVVATLGTSLTAEHIPLVRRYAKKVVLSFDADEAGVKAAFRAAELFAAASGEGDTNSDLSLRVLSLPPGDDPDSLLRRGDVPGFRRAIENALTVPEFRLRTLETRTDTRTDAGKLAFLREAVPIIASVPSLLEQDVLIRRVAAFHPSFTSNGMRAEESVRGEVVRARRGTTPLDETFSPNDGRQNGGRPPYPRRNGGAGNVPTNFRRDNNRPPFGEPQRPFVVPDSSPTPQMLPAALVAEQTLIQALLSDEWLPVLRRLLPADTKTAPPFSNPLTDELAQAMWELIVGHISPREAVGGLADARLVDHAAALWMDSDNVTLSEETIGDALRELDNQRRQTENAQIRSRLGQNGEGKPGESDELLRQWLENARTLKGGGPKDDSKN